MTFPRNVWSVSQVAYATQTPVLRHALYIDISLQSQIEFHTRYRSNYGSSPSSLYIIGSSVSVVTRPRAGFLTKVF
jgi:hypothetical protein